jgi:membrane protein implicated in regulation of membrane protease activity
MLTFIVLGIVPGTSIQLGFLQILLSSLVLFVLAVSGIYLYRRFFARKSTDTTPFIMIPL